MTETVRLFLCIAGVLLSSIAAFGQLTIEVTGPQKEAREASGGHCGSIGRKLPLQVEVEVHGGPSSEDGKSVVEFVLTNSGKEGLRIPVSPDPSDVESADTDYSYRELSVYITGDSRRERILPGGAWLYGNEESSTLVTLAPGESIRVRTKVKLPAAQETGSKGTEILVAHATLVDKTVTTVGGKTSRDCVGVGVMFADSPEYTLDALLNSSK